MKTLTEIGPVRRPVVWQNRELRATAGLNPLADRHQVRGLRPQREPNRYPVTDEVGECCC